MIRSRALSVCAGLFLWATMSAAEPLELAGTDAPYRIVLPSRPDPIETFAAEELQRYLAEMTGQTLPVAREDDGGEGPALFVGATGAGQAVAPDPRHPQDDAYAIRTDGENVVLAGCRPRATLFAVYDLLERLGCRWFAPGFRFYKGMNERVPRTGSAVLDAPLDVRAEPALFLRAEFPEHSFLDEPDDVVALIDWCAKNRINFFVVRLNEFSDAWYRVLEPECARRGLLLAAEAHGYNRFLPRSRYYRLHPEWFGPVNGQNSDRYFDQFDTQNPEAIAEFTRNLRDFVSRYPYLYAVSAMPNDSPRWTDTDTADGKPLDVLFRMYDLIVRTVHETNPNLKVSIGTGVAYFGDSGETLYEPPHPNVIFHTAVLRRTLQQPWHDPESETNHPQYRVAAKATRALREKGYDVVWSSRYAPFRDLSLPGLIYAEPMAEELRDLAALGATGINFNYAVIPAWIPYEAKHYLFARLAWDPTQDPEAILDAYYAERFPGSPEQMTAFYRALRRAMERYPFPGGGYTREERSGRYPDDQFDEGFRDLDEAQAALDVAMARNPNDDEKQLIWLLEASLRYGRGKMEIDQLEQTGRIDEARARVAELMDYLEAWDGRGIVYDSSFLRMGLERRFSGRPGDAPIKKHPVEDNRVYEFKDYVTGGPE